MTHTHTYTSFYSHIGECFLRLSVLLSVFQSKDCIGSRVPHCSQMVSLLLYAINLTHIFSNFLSFQIAHRQTHTRHTTRASTCGMCAVFAPRILLSHETSQQQQKYEKEIFVPRKRKIFSPKIVATFNAMQCETRNEKTKQEK